jgi:two-component system phosphate regulon sensor histidine kinase PhoR
LSKLILNVFLPVLLIALIIHLYFIILAWSPIEKFLNQYFPEQEELLDKNILSLWKKFMIENKNKQRDMERSNTAYVSLLNHLEEGILIIGTNGKILFNNISAGEILNFPGSVKDKFFWEIMQNTELKNQITQASDKGLKQFGEYLLHSPIDRVVAYSILPMDEPFTSKPEQLLIVLSDITKIKKLEQIRTDFVANVSHELKSPLGAILGYVETLVDEPSTAIEKRQKYLEVIYKNGIQLNAIVDDLLILSKLESDNKLEITRFNPGKLLLEITELYAEKIREQKMYIHTESVDQTLEMAADKWKIRQLMINLLDNAIKYSRLGGHIEFSLLRCDGQIVFTIMDDGIGIPMMEQDRIFERFYRVDKARSNDYTGTGLGLSIVKHIVELHQGTIALKSNRYEGSTFTISIPENLTES